MACHEAPLSAGSPVWVHLDMKGAPPTLEFLQALFPCLRRWGATGLLIEWEDMLPWAPPLDIAAHPDAYTAAEVRTRPNFLRGMWPIDAPWLAAVFSVCPQVASILAAAAAQGLDVVPLVQTFGHLEFVLKHNSFAPYREDADSYMDLCPLHPDAALLTQEIILQVGAAIRAVLQSKRLTLNVLW